MSTAFETLKRIGDELHAAQTSSNIWIGTPLESINELKPDLAGKVGEEFIKAICLAEGIPNESTGDKNSKDGTYDQKIGTGLKKTEIKTGRLGGGKYQHETLKTAGYDYMLFFDIKPEGGAITILPPFNMTAAHPITGTTPTLRKGTTDVYKWDFSELHITRLATAGHAMRFDKTTPVRELGDFMRAKIL